MSSHGGSLAARYRSSKIQTVAASAAWRLQPVFSRSIPAIALLSSGLSQNR